LLRASLLILFIITSGCATRAIQTEALLKEPPSIPAQKEISDVPYVKQTDNYCGPATLTMALQYNGHNVTLDELGKEMYTPKMKGTLQQDMISASRRHGMMAVPIENLDSLLKEIDAGHPVIVFENLLFSWYPQWHYAIIYGYDIPKQMLVMHSGPEKGKRWAFDRFERSWMFSDYWGLVILNPGELSATANELAHLNAAAGLEKIGQKEAAEKAYLGMLKKWPQSLGALIGLGNVTYQRKDFKASVKYLTLATKFHPSSVAAHNNLEVATSELRKTKL